ncbi:YceI family protein [Roseivirga sp.]|uniref:YceI family protein n=1 Tax=Roseivirga sp. TaxID=1964215 RepID=UPI003B517723
MNSLRSVLIMILTVFLVQGARAQSTQWEVDPVHSSIGFSIDHLVVSETVGHFNSYSADIKADKKDFTDASFEMRIKVESIDTKDDERDTHLKSEDFFHASKYPEIRFKGESFRKVGEGKYKVTGNLTMHGITKKVEFDAEFGGIVADPWGGTRAGLKLSGTLDRYDYDLKYNSFLEAGGLAIGREVRIECRVELIKKQ